MKIGAGAVNTPIAPRSNLSINASALLEYDASQAPQNHQEQSEIY